MKSNKLWIFTIILVLFTNFSAQKTNLEAEDKIPCDLDFARQLVEQQAADGKNTEDTGKRIKILIRAADFLWKFDEEKSRDYFTNAFDVAEDRFNELGFERKKIGSFKGEDLTVTVPDHRFEVIQEIAKKDRIWADELTKKLLKKYEKEYENRKGTLNNANEVASIMAIAYESIKTNPEVSLRLYRTALRYPLGRHWYWTLYAMWRKDADLTNQVYSEALDAYINESPSNLLFLSAYAFGSGRFFGADRFSFPIAVPQNYVPRRDLQLKFVNVFLNRAEIVIEDPRQLSVLPEKDKLAEIAYIVSGLNEMEPYVLRDLQSVAPRFRLVKSKANATMSEEIRKSLEKKENEYKDASRSFDEKLKRVELADEKGILTDQLIIDMVLRARTEEDHKRAETWIDKIRNKNARDETFSYFFFKRAEVAIRDKRLEDVERFAKKVSVVEQRAVLGFKVAEEKVKVTKQTNDVELILLEVSDLAEKLEDSVTKAKILLGLAFAFEDVNHLYALDELSKAVRVINKLDDPDVFSDYINQKISGNGYEFLTMLIAPGYNFENTFEKISKEDFQLSLAHAQSLEDKYFKTLAVLTVAKNCVINSKKPKNSKKADKEN